MPHFACSTALRALCLATHIAALLLLSFASPAIRAQGSLSTLRGVVVDPSGAVIPGVVVTAEEASTGVKARTATTDSLGNFEMPDLKQGRYRVKASLKGFKAFVADDIVLTSNAVQRVDIQLEVGDAAVEVKVSGAAPVIETEDSKLASEFTGEQYKFAPTPGNAYSSPLPVIATLPNVHFGAGCQFCMTVAGQHAGQMGMDGVKEESTNTQTVNMESVEELKVVAVNNSAEFSRAAYFNVVNKRGSNQFHGLASYYHRNSALGARGFFEPEKARQLYHTFNGSASGPIIRNKTFFYGLWNGERVPLKTYHLANVPTEKMRGGDFSQLLSIDPPSVINDPQTGIPFVGNVIPPSRLASVSTTLQSKYYPSPNRGGPDELLNNYGWFFPYPEDQFRADVIVGRIDHQFSERNNIFGRISMYYPKYVLSGSLPNLAWTRLRQSQSWAVVDTHTFSPRVVNTFTFGGNRDRVLDGDQVDNYTPPLGDQVVKEIGLQGVNPKGNSVMGFPATYISGYSPLTVQPGGLTELTKNYTLSDSLSWSTGRHTLKTGFEWRRFGTLSGGIPEGSFGQFGFDGRFSGNAYADFLLGIPSTSTRLDPVVNRTQRNKELGLFVQDSFKVTNRLTLDLGLRWDYFGSPSFEDGLMYNWDPATGDVIVPQDAKGKVSPLYDPKIRVTAGDVTAIPSKTLFAPRLGAAYRITNRTVIRGGYGIFIEPIYPYTYSSSQGGGPFQISETYTNRFEGGSALFSFPNPFPGQSGSAEVPSQGVQGFTRDIGNGRVHQFNATIEHQVRDIGLRLSYIGSRGTGLNYWLETNKPEASQIPFSDDRRPFPQFVSTYFNRRNGETAYNSVTVEASRKAGRLGFDAHYTWAHNMSDMLNLENPYAPLFWNRDFQPKHRAVINFNWDLPVGRGQQLLASAPKAVDLALGGWKFYWISFFESGQFFSPSYSGYDPSNTNSYGGLPDRTANGNLPAGQRSLERWFDVGAFVVPGCPAADPACSSPSNVGRFGNSGVNILEGPGLASHSATLAKRFALTERLRLDLMMMVSNLFNHPNFFAPATDIAVPGQAGVISGQHGLFTAQRSGPRLVELRGRIEF